jgi:hypothetical protein
MVPWWWPIKAETCRRTVYDKTNCAFVGVMINILLNILFPTLAKYVFVSLLYQLLTETGWASVQSEEIVQV